MSYLKNSIVKKLFLIIVMALTMGVVRAQDYGIDLNYNKRMIVSIDYSALNWSQGNVAGITASLNLYGVYADIGFNTQGNHSLKNDGVQRNGYKVRSYHVGYTIPITHRFRIIPIIGYMSWQSGVYNCSSQGEFKPLITEKKIDYGFKVSYEIFEAVCVSASLQRHIIGFGIGFCFNAEDWGI